MKVLLGVLAGALLLLSGNVHAQPEPIYKAAYDDDENNMEEADMMMCPNEAWGADVDLTLDPENLAPRDNLLLHIAELLQEHAAKLEEMQDTMAMFVCGNEHTDMNPPGEHPGQPEEVEATVFPSGYGGGYGGSHYPSGTPYYPSYRSPYSSYWANYLRWRLYHNSRYGSYGRLPRPYYPHPHPAAGYGGGGYGSGYGGGGGGFVGTPSTFPNTGYNTDNFNRNVPDANPNLGSFGPRNINPGGGFSGAAMGGNL
jgi:hypothetical protein